MNNDIFSLATRLKTKYRTRDPFALLHALHVDFAYTYAFPAGGLKGFCTIMNQTKYVRVNALLCPSEKRVVAAHEAGHIVCHGGELRIGAFRDGDIYRPTGKIEREANFFGAEFMLDDEEVLDLMHSCGADFFTVAKALYVPAPFFAFKLYGMVKRGYAMRMPTELDSSFLSK